MLGLRIFNLQKLDGFSARLQFGEGKSKYGAPTSNTGLKSIKVRFHQTVMGWPGSNIGPVVVPGMLERLQDRNVI